MFKFKPTVAVSYYSKESVYILGQGDTTSWERIIQKPLFCEWRSSYGERSLAAMSVGVKDSATVRTFYHPVLCKKLQLQHVLAVKNGGALPMTDKGDPDKLHPNLYEIWGGVDNVAEENQFMEFHVRRYEGK